MLNKLSIKFKLFASNLLAVLVILILSGVGIYSIQRGSADLSNVFENNVQPLGLLQEIDSLLKEVRFRLVAVPQEQMSIKGSRDQLAEARARLPKAWEEFNNHIDRKGLENESLDIIEKIDGQIKTIDAFFAKLDGIYASENKNALLAPLQEEWPQINRNLLKPIAQLIPVQEEAVKKTYEKSSANGKKLIVLTLIVMLAGAGVLLVFAFWLVNAINRNIHTLNTTLKEVSSGNLTVKAQIHQQDELGSMAESINQTITTLNQMIAGVKRAADELAASSSSLSAEAQKVAQRSDTQSDRVMQVSAAMEEMSVSVTQISTGAQEVARASIEAEAVARQGSESMVRNTIAAQQTVESVNVSSSVILKLSESINKIHEITNTIKDIAEQTNLLALNAAIEAARAGEQGRGFAVVADEVRKLAERTASSTSDITQTVASIHDQTAASVKAMEDVKLEVESTTSNSKITSESLAQISRSAASLTGLANQIAAATQEQSSASEEIAQSMEAISSMTEESTESIHSVSQEAKKSAQTSAELLKLVERFKLKG